MNPDFDVSPPRCDCVNISSTAVFMHGSSTAAAPTVSNPTTAMHYPAADRLWSWLADAANYAEDQVGMVGWAAFNPESRFNVAPLAPGTVRALIDPLWDRATYVPSIRAFVLDDEDYTMDPDVICHEFAHSIDAEIGPANGSGPMSRMLTNGSLRELVADLFAIYCEANSHPTRAPWVIGDIGVSGPVRSIPDARQSARSVDAGGAGGYRHYDAYRGTGDTSRYAPTFLVTRALYLAVTTYGLPFERGEPLAVRSPGWSATSYPAFRDRMLSQALTYAQSVPPTFDYTMQDVCALARGLRDTGLDGEYGTEILGTEPDRAGGHATLPSLICTETECPICDGIPEPVDPPLCTPEQLMGPTCMNAYDEPICLDAISDDATDCPMMGGVQTVRSCICTENIRSDAPPVWAFCSPQCRLP